MCLRELDVFMLSLITLELLGSSRNDWCRYGIESWNNLTSKLTQKQKSEFQFLLQTKVNIKLGHVQYFSEHIGCQFSHSIFQLMRELQLKNTMNNTSDRGAAVLLQLFCSISLPIYGKTSGARSHELLHTRHDWFTASAIPRVPISAHYVTWGAQPCFCVECRHMLYR